MLNKENSTINEEITENDDEREPLTKKNELNPHMELDNHYQTMKIFYNKNNTPLIVIGPNCK